MMVCKSNKRPYENRRASEELLMHFIRSTHVQAKIFGKITNFNENGEI